MNLTVEDLRQDFDKVKLYYSKEEIGATGQFKKVTRAALVKGGVVYIGIAECDPRDQFNKSIGRQMALGRAFFIAQVTRKEVAPRKSSRLAYVRTADASVTVDDILKQEVFK